MTDKQFPPPATPRPEETKDTKTYFTYCPVCNQDWVPVPHTCPMAPSAPEAPTADAARSASPQFTVVYVEGHDGKPVAAPCCLSGCQYNEALKDAIYHRDCRPNRRKAEAAMADAKALADWRADVTSALGREGGAHFADVPQHIRDLVKQVRSLQAQVDSEAERAVQNDGLLAAQARIAELKSELTTLRSTHATLQSALRLLANDWRGTATMLSADAHDSTLLREEQAYSAAKRTTLTWCADKLDKALSARE